MFEIDSDLVFIVYSASLPNLSPKLYLIPEFDQMVLTPEPIPNQT